MSVTRLVLQSKAVFVAMMFVASVVMAPVAIACDTSAVTEKSNNGNAYAYGQDKKDIKEEKESKNKTQTPVVIPEVEDQKPVQKPEDSLVKEITKTTEQAKGQIGEAASTTKPSAAMHSAKNTTNPTGNNGTLKVHEYGTESAFINNDPKVCMFNFEGFGFDVGQDGYIMIEGQCQTKSIYGPYNFGPTTASEKYRSYAETMYFNRDGNPTIPNGHYKATLYGKDNGGILDLKDEKAKSKVFKVSCESTPTTPTDPTDPSNPGTGDVEGAETVSHPTTNTNTPATLPSTGSEIAFMAAIAGAIAGFVGIVSYLIRYTYLKIS